MIEFFLAFFIFITIFIDTLSIAIKATKARKRFAVVYVASQALTYMTRLSLFFIMPIIGLILDGVIAFDINQFILWLALLFLGHSLYFLFFYKNIVDKSHLLIYFFTKDLFKFYRFLFTRMIYGKAVFIGFNRILSLYLTAHLALSLLFPFVIWLGVLNNEYRGFMMGSIGVFSGVFSIYILFFIERKIPVLSQSERRAYISRLVFTKVMATSVSAVVLLLVVIGG